MSRAKGKKKAADPDVRLPPGDYVFLSFLLYAPMTAYDIKKAMAGSVSNFWAAAHSQVYQQAARLVRDGYVSEKEVDDGRRKRILSLTPAGRRAVREWLREPEAPSQLFSEMLVKTFFAPQAGDLEATLEMIEREQQERQGLLDEYELLYRQLQGVEELRYPALTVRMGIGVAKTWIAWCDEAIAQIKADLRAAKKKR